MKKIFNKVTAKMILLVNLFIISMHANASSGSGEGNIDYNKVISKPEFWVGLVLFIGFITAASLMGRSRKDIS